MSLVVRLEQGLARVGTEPRLRRVAVALAVLVVLVGLLFRLGAEPIARKSEARTFEVARAMQGGRGWLVPRMDGEPRLQKPPLYYWAAAAALSVERDPIRALRLPSALAGMGLVATVFLWGRRAGGFASGTLAALSLLSMFKFWELGRRGDAEMTLAFLTAQALFAFDRIYWERRRDLLPWFFGAALLAFLARATAAVLVIGLPIALRLGLDGTWRRAPRGDVLAWALGCGLACLAWYAAILWWVPGAWEVLRQSLLLPFGLAKAGPTVAAHLRPVWYYLPKLFVVAWPAAVLVPLAVWHVVALRSHPQRGRATFPALAFASLFVAFSLLPMKQRHYLMPLLPLLALTLAPALIAAYERHRSAVERTVAVLGYGLLVVAPAGSLLVLHLVVADEGAPAIALVGIIVLVACATGFAAARHGCVRVFGLAVVALTLALVGVHRTSFDPLRESFRQGVEPDWMDFDAKHWARTFERHPVLRSVYLADAWRMDSGETIEDRAQHPAVGSGPS
jgi:4-amino-4-deoxy-L-arabinose transferase-like glycosyltransferase